MNDRLQRFYQQFSQLLQREWILFKQQPFIIIHLKHDDSGTGKKRELRIPQWILSLLLMPTLFALAISLAVPTVFSADANSRYEPHLAGFLCILSVIWLAASQSHLSLTNSYRRLDYEFDQGLRPYPLVAAKSASQALTACLQATVFFVCYWIIRSMILMQPMFYARLEKKPEAEGVSQAVGFSRLGDNSYSHLDEHWFGILVTLLAVAVCASQLGLLISALSKWRVSVASTILPIVMMIQILFSPFVVRAAKSDQVVQATYAGFWWHNQCQGVPGCPATDVVYTGDGKFVCEDCIFDLGNNTDEPPSSATLQSQLANRSVQTMDRRQRYATLASYLTLTRHADLAIRPIVGKLETETAQERYGYVKLRRIGLQFLVLLTVLFHVLICLCVGVSYRWR